MARVEKQDELKEEISKMKSKLDSGLGEEKKNKHGFVKTVLLLFLVLIVVVVLGIGWVVAATGLVKIPILSSMAYEKPEPTRVVEAGVSLEDLVKAEFEIQFAQHVIDTSGILEDMRMDFHVPEDALTTTLRSGIEETGDDQIEAVHAQVVVLAETGFELYLPVKDSPQETAIMVTANLSILESKTNIEIIEVKLGSLSLPEKIINAIIVPIAQRQIEGMLEKTNLYAQIESIEYAQGEVIIRTEASIDGVIEPFDL